MSPMLPGSSRWGWPGAVCDDGMHAGHARLGRRSRFPRVPRSNDRIVAGVAGGWADRWGVEPTVVRAALGLLTLAGGIGVVLYGIAALGSTPPVGRSKPDAQLPSSVTGAASWRSGVALPPSSSPPAPSGCGLATAS